jgi:DNA replication and repair protein RecF
MDRLLGQTDRGYLEDLMAYQRVLEQRNALLRAPGGAPPYDHPSMQVWNEQLVAYAGRLVARRNVFAAAFDPLFDQYYRYVAGSRETAALAYRTHVTAEGFGDALRAAWAKDRALGHTTAGAHKDDLELTIDGHDARKFASQGQQKSVAVALKLAQFALVGERLGRKPIVMLDDLFDKLDDERVARILGLAGEEAFGQLFISDTHPGRVFRFLREAGVAYRPYNVHRGTVTEEAAYA